jgi:O-acetyl-ADP-ribose deacetylase (regulator of RNase III)
MIFNQDILNIPTGVIVHQVNCQHVMGRGLALAIRQKWPEVFKEYIAYAWKPGQVQFVKVATNLYVCNLAGQLNYGLSKPHTMPEAHLWAWPKVAKWASKRELPVYAPWKIGCGCAGGDWAVIQPLIENILPSIRWCVSDESWVKYENSTKAYLANIINEWH